MSTRTTTRRAGILALIVLVAVAGALSGCGKKKFLKPFGFYEQAMESPDNGTFSVEITSLQAQADVFLMDVIVRNNTDQVAVFDPADIEITNADNGVTYFHTTKNKEMVSTRHADLILPMELKGGQATSGKLEFPTGDRTTTGDMFPSALVLTYGDSTVTIP